MVTKIVFSILHVLELAGIGYFFYEWYFRGLPPIKPEASHGHCTICGKKVAKWARPGVCVNCG